MLFLFWLLVISYNLDRVLVIARQRPQVHQPKQDVAGPLHCSTPLNETGMCVDIRECPFLLTLLRSFATAKWNPQIANLLRRSQCGFRNNSPYVCCREWLTKSTTPENSFKPTEISIESGLFHRSPVESSSKWRECGISPRRRTRDRNPKNATSGDWPWAAVLGYRNSIFPGIDFKCGATLISDRWVVTAAHCVKNIGNFEVSMVRLGVVDLNPAVQNGAAPIDVPIEDIIVHPNYSTSPIINDIALLLLSNTVQFSSNIRPACLLNGDKYLDDAWYKNKAPFIIGWGAINWSGAASTKLQEYTISIVNFARCTAAYADHSESQIDEKVLCAGQPSRDPCQGDPGGTLLFPVGSEKFYLGGIVSYGIRCENPDTPTGGVYTKIAAFINWISQNTGLNFSIVMEPL